MTKTCIALQNGERCGCTSYADGWRNGAYTHCSECHHTSGIHVEPRDKSVTIKRG
jgi:hypothetical protein